MQGRVCFASMDSKGIFPMFPNFIFCRFRPLSHCKNCGGGRLQRDSEMRAMLTKGSSGGRTLGKRHWTGSLESTHAVGPWTLWPVSPPVK